MKGQNPRPSAIIGQHVMPSIESGKIGIRSGKFMASMDELFVTVIGKVVMALNRIKMLTRLLLHHILLLHYNRL